MAGAVAKSRNNIPEIVMENVRIGFRNFSGKEGTYNREGNRNFVVFLDDPKVVEQLIEDGWNVKYLKPREEDDLPQPYLPVAVNYRGPRPPRLVMITSRGRNDIPEDLVMVLDWAEIEHVDLIVRPYQWDVSGKTGVKAYLKSIYITIREDELEMKYADVPDSAQNIIGGGPDRLQIESGGRLPHDPDEIVIEDPDADLPWNRR